MPTSTTNAILKRIRAKHRGSVFTPRQFAHLGTRAAVDQALSRLQRSGQIRRLTRGVYEFPKIHPRIGVLSPSPEAVAKAMAERTGSRIHAQTRCPFQNDWRGNGGGNRNSGCSVARERGSSRNFSPCPYKTPSPSRQESS